VHPAISTTSGNGSCRPRRVRRCRRGAFTVDRPQPVGCQLPGTVAHLPAPPTVLITPGLLVVVVVVVVVGDGFPVDSRKPRVDSRPSQEATNQRRWDSAMAPVHPQAADHLPPRAVERPAHAHLGRQAVAGPRCPRGTWLVGGTIIAVVSGRVLPICCAPVYAAASVGGLAARSWSGRSRPAPGRPGAPVQTRRGSATTRRPGRTSGH